MYTIQVYFVECGPSLRKLLTAFNLMFIGHNFLNFKTLSDTLSENSELGIITSLYIKRYDIPSNIEKLVVSNGNGITVFKVWTEISKNYYKAEEMILIICSAFII